MNRLLRAELLKQRTTPAFQIVFAAVPVLAALVTLAVYGAAGHQGNDPLGPDSLMHAAGAPASVVAILALLLGAAGITGEYRHQTITTALLAAPRRRGFVAAKVAAHVLTGAAMAVVTLAVSLAIAVPWLMSAGVPVRVTGEVVRVAAGLAVSTALYAGLGVGTGALLRNQTAAVGVVLVWVLKGEDLFAGAVHSWVDVGHWLPASLAEGLVRAGAGAPPAWAGALVLTACAAVAALAGARLVARRDVT